MFLTGFVYPCVSHWIWASNGWLSAFNQGALVWDSGMIDFAGSGVVHMTGGFAGLMGAAIIGPRSGRFQSDGTPSPNFQGHSVTLVVLGTFILWYGWYGFNPGSMLAINTYVTVVSRTAVTTTLSAAAGGVSALLWAFMKTKCWDLSQACNGVLCGLVGITAGCSTVDPAAAVLCGVIAAVLFDVSSTLLLKLHIDDPLGAAPMHGFCGAYGVLFTGLFARKEYVMEAYGPTGQIQYGVLFGGGWKLFGCQVVGVVSIVAWVCTLIGGLFMIMKMAGILRVPVDEEILGLDVSHHGGKAYNNDDHQATEMSAR
jgi:Amt family ammonium transporter